MARIYYRRAGNAPLSLFRLITGRIIDDDWNDLTVAVDCVRLAWLLTRSPEWPHPVAVGWDRIVSGISRGTPRRENAGLPVGMAALDFALPDLKRPSTAVNRVATKRLSVDARGRIVYRYKQPFRDGSTHVVMEPLHCLARLAALVPRPRLNLTRFHGVFAPNLKHRPPHRATPCTGPGGR